VLINLITNAVKFTETGSVSLLIDIAGNENSSTEQTFLHFKVVDTGPGIQPEEIEQLFKAFAQTERGRKSQQGTGLGLAISQKYVQVMGGTITVSSEPGSVTTFSFTIPVRVPARSYVDEKESCSFAESLESTRIEGESEHAKQLASIAALPATLVSELKEAATYCEVDGISRIITEIRKQDDDLAGRLDRLLKEFDFDRILAFLGQDS
jgi:DNA topoisomerase VI subunit B